ESELDRRRQALPDVLGDGPARENRIPEIAEQDVLDVEAVLDGQGLVEAEVMHQDLLIALARIDVQEQVDRVAREPCQDEHDADHDEHAQHRLEHPTHEIPQHALLPWSGGAAPLPPTPPTGHARRPSPACIATA